MAVPPTNTIINLVAEVDEAISLEEEASPTDSDPMSLKIPVITERKHLRFTCMQLEQNMV